MIITSDSNVKIMNVLFCEMCWEGNHILLRSPQVMLPFLQDFGVIGADITLLTHKNLTFRIDYDAELGRANHTAHYVSRRLRWEF